MVRGVNESVRVVRLVQLCPPTPAATETGNAGISSTSEGFGGTESGSIYECAVLGCCLWFSSERGSSGVQKGVPPKLPRYDGAGHGNVE